MKTQGFASNTKKILWILITAAACFIWFMVVGIITSIIDYIVNIGTNHGGSLTKGGAVVAVIGIVILIIISIIIWGHIKMQCPVCKKTGAMLYVKEDIISEKEISVPINLHRKNQKGEIIDTYQQYVSGVRKTFKTTYFAKVKSRKWLG